MKSQKPLTNTDASLGDILNQLSIYFFELRPIGRFSLNV